MGKLGGRPEITYITGTRGSIKARFCILTKRSLNKLPSGCGDQIKANPPSGKSTIPKTNLQTPQAVCEIFAQLNVDLLLLYCVFSKPLARQALFKLLPKNPPLLLVQLFFRDC